MNAAAIHTAEILVRFANPPEDGKKASIKASDGTYYGVAPADFGRFQPGGRYRIEFTERIWKGKPYRDIKSGEPLRPNPATAPSAKQNDTEAEGTISNREIGFVTHCLAASIASHAVGRTQQDLVDRIKVLRAAYREGLA